MIRILFKQLLDNKSFQDKKRITIGEVCEETGISRATMTRISNQPGYNTNTDTVNLLCEYFDCEAGELLQFIREVEE